MVFVFGHFYRQEYEFVTQHFATYYFDVKHIVMSFQSAEPRTSQGFPSRIGGNNH